MEVKREGNAIIRLVLQMCQH